VVAILAVSPVQKLTAAHIQAALKAAGAGSGLVMPADKIATAFNDAISKYGGGLVGAINSYAALVSECMMESAYFRTTQEYASTGPYQPYRGRTFIQITWKDNYAAFGKWCKSVGLLDDADYFVKNPTKLADLRWAAIGGVWYFTKVLKKDKKGVLRPIVWWADDPLAIGRAVNMGNPYSTATPNGQKARDAAYVAVVKALTATPQEPDVPLTDADLDKIADRVLSRDGVIPNAFTTNKANEFVALSTALAAIGKQLDEISSALAAFKK
jgi:hypothetical protein